MRVEYIQISNILSFKYFEDISKVEKIEFNNDLNILIGENGSGKSTILEVINFIFKRVLFSPVTFNYNVFENRNNTQPNNKKSILNLVDNLGFKEFRLDPSWDTENKQQIIRIKIILDQIDFDNIDHLKLHYEKLSSLASIYTRQQPILDFHSLVNEVIIDIVLNYDSNTFSVDTPFVQKTNTSFQYLQYYKFYQELIYLHNSIHPDDIISLLNEPFIIISSFRNYHNFNPSISLKDANAGQQIKQIRERESSLSINAGEQNEPSIFGLVRLNIAEKHFKLIETKLDKNECEAEVNEMPFLISINEKLKLINLKCKIKLIDMRTWQYAFEFFDIRRSRLLMNINSLSAGQKAIAHLVFEAYGRGDLKGGLVIIDEPEIHLHYQFQNEYLHVIEEINKEQKCQYIMVTHSESLINSQTINHIKRFSLNTEGNTIIYSPYINIDQTILIKILDNTKSNYAFFSKKIIFVEGDTDRYFYTELLVRLYPGISHEISVLNLFGKGNFDKWKIFFESFGLKVYFIGDFDNVFNLGIVNVTDDVIRNGIRQEKLGHLSAQQLIRIKTKYNALIEDIDFIEKPKLQPWIDLFSTFKNVINVSNDELIMKLRTMHADINANIEMKYKDGIFILKKGSIENYTHTPHANLDKLVEFCEKDMDIFIKSRSEGFLELESILNKIIVGS
ncbi:MAG: AAA family ATPase [Gammaproteobacteria bacterium]